jgi:chromosome segregation ATPase
MEELILKNVDGYVLLIGYIAVQLIVGRWRKGSESERNKIEAERAKTDALEVTLEAVKGLQCLVNDLMEDKIKTNRKRIELENKVDALIDEHKREIQAVRDEQKITDEKHRKVIDQTTREIYDLKVDLKTANRKIAELTRELSAKEAQIGALKSRIDELQKSSESKDAEIAKLLNGKADKPITDDMTAAAQEVREGADVPKEDEHGT